MRTRLVFNLIKDYMTHQVEKVYHMSPHGCPVCKIGTDVVEEEGMDYYTGTTHTCLFCGTSFSVQIWNPCDPDWLHKLKQAVNNARECIKWEALCEEKQ